MEGDFFMGFADLIFPDEDNSGMGITPDRCVPPYLAKGPRVWGGPDDNQGGDRQSS
ncbi:hypothetical protein HanXRQr2_Chr14g0623701 [Helianthus annuus]|uniref:Uncharacterized protein n=1 Tax=Helianthus annuus TaxID=4232 RepID=A0A251SDV2_HELAN|nr:hypothetical protein HanXRQr2_Chr14g0623701 [Helianthus annuus]KAJ0838754.1 hypothetical protein HanPSC8_Chr14g0598541 [Helianthus annuus]